MFYLGVCTDIYACDRGKLINRIPTPLLIIENPDFCSKKKAKMQCIKINLVRSIIKL